MDEKTSHSLDKIPAGKRVIVVSLRGGMAFVNRMGSLGFTPGVEVRVVRNYRHGPLIVMLRGARVALGRGTAAKVLVERQKNDQEQRAPATKSSL